MVYCPIVLGGVVIDFFPRGRCYASRCYGLLRMSNDTLPLPPSCFGWRGSRHEVITCIRILSLQYHSTHLYFMKSLVWDVFLLILIKLDGI